MQAVFRDFIRKFCPNIPYIHQKLSQAKLQEFDRYIMPREDVSRGETSFDEMKAVVAKYSQKREKHTAVLNEKFEEYCSRCDTVRARNDLEDLRIKVLFKCFAYGFAVDEFFVYELEHKTVPEVLSYISDTELKRLIYSLNDIIDVDVFFDKFKTYEKFGKYYKRDAVRCKKRSDYSSFSDFVDKHPKYVRKNVRLSKGDSVELVDSINCKETKQQLFDKMIENGETYIVEELVIQSEAMSRLNSTSVNTVRVITFMTKQGVYIGPCFLKIGQGGSFVDNGGKGGILIGIDNQTGKLDTFGYDEFLKEYRKHPDTGVEFIGLQLPEWRQLLQLAAEISNQMPTVRYIGWDFAHTDNGWIVIEGNGSSQLIGPQIVWKRGFKEEVRNILNE